MDKQKIRELILDAFRQNDYPGDPFLQGSFEGCEPYDEVTPFRGKLWSEIEPGFLDAHAAALSFFSEAGFRFFLPAYLIADLNGQLQTADPVFHLTHGFSDTSMKTIVQDRSFTIRTGKSQFINPKRYGAATFYDIARYKLSIFTREEAAAIVAYLEYQRDFDPSLLEKDQINAALNLFWLDRAKTAPTRESLEDDLRQRDEFHAAILKKGES